MNTRRIRIKTKHLSETDEHYLISGTVNLIIPKDYVIKTGKNEFFDYNTRPGKKIQWTSLYLDTDFFKHKAIIDTLRKLKNDKKVFIYGRKQFGVNWDAVINRMYTRPLNQCFYCDVKMRKGGNKVNSSTKDHVIPRVMVEAYGYNYLDDNTVPCCRWCNQHKGSLHPYTFREKVKHKLSYLRKGRDKWEKILKTLNKILIEKKDPLL